MKQLAALMLVSLPVLAQDAGQFRWEAPVTVSGVSPNRFA